MLSPVDAQDPIDTFLLSIGLAGLSDQNDFTILFREPGCDDTVSSQQAANRAPRSFVAVLFEPFTNPTQKMVGENADKDMSLNPLFKLMKVGAKSQRAF